MKFQYTQTHLNIARLMGLHLIEGVNDNGEKYYYYNNPEAEDFEALPFYNTYAELMPVVEKIESLGAEHKVVISQNVVRIKTHVDDVCLVGDNKLDALYQSIKIFVDNYCEV